MILTQAGRELVWQKWDGFFILYQPSSAETHVFNETTALILKCLGQGPLLLDAVKDFAENALRLNVGELDVEAFALAAARLEELGLVASLEQALATQ